MADLAVHAGLINLDGGTQLIEKIHDNGDGTYSRTVAVVYGGGGGGGADIQYADGATQATPTGNAVLWKDASNVLHVPSIANALPVQQTDGAGNVLGTTTHPVVTQQGNLSYSSDNVSAVGYAVHLSSTPTINTGAYVAGNCVGGLIQFTSALRINNGTGILQSLTVADHANQRAALDILFFSAAPAATFTDHAAFPTLSDADSALIIRRVSVVAADYIVVGGTATADISAIGKIVAGTAGTQSLWMAVNTSGTPTYGDAAALTFHVGILQN